MSKELPHQTLARLVGFGPRVPKAELPDEGEPPRTDEGALFETGEELIQSIFGAISLRRPVLVTSSRVSVGWPSRTVPTGARSIAKVPGEAASSRSSRANSAGVSAAVVSGSSAKPSPRAAATASA